MVSDARRVEEMELFRKRPGLLMRVLQRSRDKWKSKCQQAKGETRQSRQRVRDLQISRDQWRDQAEEHRLELERLRAENARLQALAQAETDRPPAKTSRQPR